VATKPHIQEWNRDLATIVLLVDALERTDTRHELGDRRARVQEINLVAEEVFGLNRNRVSKLLDAMEESGIVELETRRFKNKTPLGVRSMPQRTFTLSHELGRLRDIGRLVEESLASRTSKGEE
jgi:hypothetical protein